MMRLNLLFTITLICIAASANAAGPKEPVFAAMTARYWCTYQAQPRTVNDIAAVQGSIEGADPKLLKDLQAYLNKITVEGNSERVIITYSKPHPSGDPALVGHVKAEVECISKASNRALKEGTPRSGAP